jgi:hypothetical protein
MSFALQLIKSALPSSTVFIRFLVFSETIAVVPFNYIKVVLAMKIKRGSVLQRLGSITGQFI